ncbi:MAG: zinc ribbon domain-containing protein [Clostridiales bacterium]|nr:zinc ribbon domain-containing protein [Clostridiales bacterium]
MALIKCKECGNEVSNKAKKCPNCVCPIKGQTYTKIISTILFIFIAIAIFASIFSSGEQTTNSNSQTTLSNQYIVIYNQIKSLKQSLNNPNSFQLHNVYIYNVKKDSVIYDLYSEYFNVLVDYSGENLMGGTTRKYMVYQYQTNKNDNNSNIQCKYYEDYSNFKDADSLAKKTCRGSKITEGTTTTLDVNDILNYIN